MGRPSRLEAGRRPPWTRSPSICRSHPGSTCCNTDYLTKNRDIYGTQSFDQHLSELYRAGAITLDVARAAASNPSDFERALSFE